MSDTPATFTDPEITTITDLVTEITKTYSQMTYLWKKNTNETTHQYLRNKDVYESDIHNIYNIIVGQTHEQLQQKATPDDTFQAVKYDRYPIVYLIILNRLCFSNKSQQQPIRSLFLDTRSMYNTMQYINNNTTEYLVRFRNAQKVNEACDGSLITRGVYKSMGRRLYSYITILDLIIYRNTITRRK